MDYRIKLNRKKPHPLFQKWTWRMAWRDARHHWSRLFLFISAIIIGIAALVAINAFNLNLSQAMDDQARELLGADMEVEANAPFEEELLSVFDSIPAEQATEASMASMVSFYSATPGARLIRLIAWEGNFPFYGEIELVPEDALDKMRSGRYAMVDENLAIQYEVTTGDSLRVGNLIFRVAGVVRKIPGGGEMRATITPSVYIDKEYLDSTGLVQVGSRVNYKQYFKTDDPEGLVATLRPMIRKFGHRYETAESQKEDLGEAVTNVYLFFNMLSFIALILGSIGVASAVHIYTKEKHPDVAVLRCMGATGNQPFIMYLVQILIFGFFGSFIGATVGLGIQFLLPVFFENMLPVNIDVSIQWIPFVQGLLLGLIIAIIFSLLPLINVRYVPPLAVIRQAGYKVTQGMSLRVVLYLLAVLFLYGFAVFQTRDWLMAGAFIGGLLVSFLGLFYIGKGVIWSAGKLVKKSRGFIQRQAFSNLFRPQNQTVTLVVVIGLGAFLLATLEVVQGSLIKHVETVGGKNTSNTILFDIQPYQTESLLRLTRDYDFPVDQFVPIVTCRLLSVNGRTVDEIQQDTTDNISNRHLTREYRVTYRDSLKASETMEEGQLQQIRNDSIFVTITGWAERGLDLEIGDSLTFDVQGVPVKVFIGGLRDLEWRNDPPNFTFVFPTGVLEDAPQIFVLATNIKDPLKGNEYQREVVASYPNVSLIDLRLILRTLQDFFDKVSLVIRFMALFSLLTGLVVLAGAVINSKFGRLKENVLLRTLGALKKQIIGLTIVEYSYLGFIAGATGILLSLVSGKLLAEFLYEVPFAVDVLNLLFIWLAVTGLTVLIGWWNTRDITSRSPLEVLRRT